MILAWASHFNQHKTRSDHRRIALAIQEYDTIGPYLNSNPPKSGARVNLSYSFFLFFFHFNLFQGFFGVSAYPQNALYSWVDQNMSRNRY